MRRVAFILAIVLTAATLGGCISITTSGRATSTAITTAVPIQPGWVAPTASAGTPLPDIADVVPLITPSVVSIQTEAIGYNVFLQPFPEQGAGTGIIIDAGGYILTNNHVVEGTTKVTVTLNDGRTFDASQVRTDPQTDLAVLKIDATGLPAAHVGDPRKLRVGDWVVAVGNALALDGGPTVTKGIVSYLGRSIQEEGNGPTLNDLIQTDAAINPGNSGGPLVNMAGEVVGINTAMAGSAQNIGFAISISSAMPIVQSLISKGFVARAYFGITMQTVTSSVARQNQLAVQKGVLVASVQRGSPAEKAGMKVGDVIVTFGGTDVSTADGLRQAIFSHQAGDIVDVVFYRGSGKQTVQATLGASGG